MRDGGFAVVMGQKWLRVQALDTSGVFSDPITVKPDITGEVFGELEEVPNFPEVDRKVLDPNFIKSRSISLRLGVS